jgi:hypothetical protein
MLTQQRCQRSNNFCYNVNLPLTNSKVFNLFIFKIQEPYSKNVKIQENSDKSVECIFRKN